MALRDGEMILSSSEVVGGRIDSRESVSDRDRVAGRERGVLAGVLVYLTGSAVVALTVGAIVARMAPASASLLVWCVVAGLIAVFAGLRVRSLLDLSFRFADRFLG